MKIKYEFVNGERTEVEVDDAVGTIILDSRRVEENGNRRERYHCYLMDDADYEGNEHISEETPETVFFGNIESERINKSLAALSEVQRSRLILFSEGVSINEIARREGLQPSTVWKSIEGAKKKFLKNF